MLRSRLIEELIVEKFAFWDHIPYRALGIFYGASPFNGSEQKSKDILAECRQEYDAAVAQGKPVHRVSDILFSKARIVRGQLDTWYESTLPLKSFPDAFVCLQTYSWCSLVERRVEEVHSRLQRLGKTMTNVHVPYVCALLRQEQAIHALRSSSEFSSFCISIWRRRDFLNSLLHLRFTDKELSNLTNSQKLEQVYQCGLESEFETTAQSRAEAKLWHRQQPQLALPAVPTDVHQCVLYWKNTLCDGCFYSMPTPLFQSVIAGSSVEPSGADLVELALAAIDGPIASIGDEFTVFKVVNLFPESRFKMPVLHQGQSRTCVNISKCGIVSKNPDDAEDIVVDISEEIATLDFQLLANSMGQALESIFRWEPARTISSWKVKAIALPVFNEDVYDLPPIVGSASRASGAAAHSTTLALYDAQQRDVRTHALIQELMARKAFVTGGNGPVNMGSLLAWSMDNVSALNDLKIVQLSTSEFGEMSIAIDPSKLDHSALVKLRSPTQHCRLPAPRTRKECKLDLMFQLRMLGWMPELNPADIAGSDNMGYVADLNAPLSYFSALVHSAEILGKGVCIRHGGLDAYYKCLRHLSAEALASLDVDGQGKKSNSFWQKQLNDSVEAVEAFEPVEAIEDQPVEMRPLAVQDFRAGVLDDNNILHCEVQHVGYRRQIVDAGEGTPSVKIYFDNFSASESASSQRGFLNCDIHSCIKYRPVGDESLEEFCARSYCWYLAGHNHDTKQEHLCHAPTAQEVTEMLQKIRLRSF